MFPRPVGERRDVRSVLSALALPILAIAILWCVWLSVPLFTEMDTAAANGRLKANHHPDTLRLLLGTRTAAALLPSDAMTAGPPAKVRPVFAVVVPVATDRLNGSVEVRQRTVTRLRHAMQVALAFGSPWLMLTGSSRACAFAAEALRASLQGDGLMSLFTPAAEDASQNDELTSQLAANSTAAWRCLLRQASHRSADLGTAGRVPLVFAPEEAAAFGEYDPRNVDRTSSVTSTQQTEKRLLRHLATHPQTTAMPHSTRALAAYLVAQESAKRKTAGTHRQGSLHEAEEDDVTVYAGDGTRRAVTPEEDREALLGARVMKEDLWRYPRVWWASGAAACGFSPDDFPLPPQVNEEEGNESSQPQRATGDVERPLPFILPGVLTVPVESPTAVTQAHAVAEAVRVRIEDGVLAQKRLDPEDGTTWSFFNKTYSVVILHGDATRQRTKMLHQMKFRETRSNMFAALRTAVTAAATGMPFVEPESKGLAQALYLPWVGGRSAESLLSALPPFIRSGNSLRGGYLAFRHTSLPATPHYPDLFLAGHDDGDVPWNPPFRSTSAPERGPMLSFAAYKAQLAAVSAATEAKDDGKEDAPVARSGRTAIGRPTSAPPLSLLHDGRPPPDAGALTLQLGLVANYLMYNAYAVLGYYVWACAWAMSGFNAVWFVLMEAAVDVARGDADWRDWFP